MGRIGFAFYAALDCTEARRGAVTALFGYIGTTENLYKHCKINIIAEYLINGAKVDSVTISRNLNAVS